MLPSPSFSKAKSRTSNRDQAIRKKFQSTSSLPVMSSRKVAGGSGVGQAGVGSRSASGIHAKTPIKPGTVMSMCPSEPIILAETDFVVQMARSMAGRKSDAVLVVDNYKDQNLVGIVTDKDLTYRCVAEGLDAARTTISVIMTKNPVHIRSDAAVDQAMNMMLNGHFRHLPVVDEHKIVGLLDITKVMQVIQSKIQNSWGKARALKTAFQEFKSSWQNFTATPEVAEWFEDWSSKMVEPDLTSVIDLSAAIPEIGFKTSVRDAARLMKEMRHTAVIVGNAENDLAGIFTTKDICLRVIAPNEVDPKSTSVVRVMTPHPDFALDSMTVQDALKKMHDGHYLHLPVKSEKENRVVGLVDVLGLTYHVMDMLIKQQALLPTDNPNTSFIAKSSGNNETNEETTPGPMWSQFWDSNGLNNLEQHQQDDSFEHGTVASSRFGGMACAGVDTASRRTRDHSQSRMSDMLSAQTVIQLLNFPFKFRDPFTGKVHRFSCSLNPDETNTTVGEISDTSADGIVMTGENSASATDRVLLRLLEAVVRKCVCDFTLTPQKSLEEYKMNHLVSVKLKDPSSFKIIDDEIPSNESTVESITPTPSSTQISNITFRLSYKDEEGDAVVLASDADIFDAVNIARQMGWSRVVLLLEAYWEDPNTGTKKLIQYQPPNNEADISTTSKLNGNDMDFEDSCENLLITGDQRAKNGGSDKQITIPLNTALAIGGGLLVGLIVLLKIR